MDIREMKAGRKLDVLIANKVMGRDDKFGELASTRMVMDDTCGRTLDGGYKERTPYYSTDISATWKLVTRFYPIMIYHYSTMGDETGYRVTIEDVIVMTETAPLAICLAALLVMEGKDGK